MDRGEVSAVCVYQMTGGTLRSPDHPCVGRTYADVNGGDSGGPVLFNASPKYLVGIVGGIHDADEAWFSLVERMSMDFGGVGLLRP